jgi:hypothetical protein
MQVLTRNETTQALLITYHIYNPSKLYMNWTSYLTENTVRLY